MQLSDRSGIACDSCGTTYKEDFKYYSFDFRLCNVFNDKRKAIDLLLREQPVNSLDICNKCFDKMRKQVVATYKPVRKGMVCDLTGKELSGTYDFYHCNITEVIVSLSEQPFSCTSCQTKTYDDSSTCKKCGGEEFVKVANVKTDDRHLELMICDDAYQDLVDKSRNIRKVAGEWATKSS